MVTSGDGSEEAPREGYYPDPSIPGYVRYWNGSSWVPGTSRPEPAEGEALAPPPGASPAAAPAVSQVPPRRPGPASVEESGPMFLDEDPGAPTAQRAEDAEPPSAWRAEPTRPSGTGWGTGGDAGGTPGPGVPQEGGYGYPRPAPPATAGGYGYPQSAPPVTPGGYGYPQAAADGPGQGGAVPWQRQVHDLARNENRPPGGTVPESDLPVTPWRPPVDNPFLLDVEQARPAAAGRRLAARVVDTLLVAAVVGGAVFPLVAASVRHIQDKIDAARLSGENVQVWLIDGTTGVCLAVVLAGLLLAGLLYEVLPTVKWGRTLGKKLFGVRVLDIDSQLTPRFGQALRRMLVHHVLDLVAVGALGVLWCLFDRPWRQGWHDKAARTFVASG